MFRPVVKSRREYLAVMAGLALMEPLLTSQSATDPGYCPDAAGRDDLSAPSAVQSAKCADCKKLSILAAHKAIYSGARLVELCMTVSDDPEEHVFLRVDGQLRDPTQEAGGPARRVQRFVAVTVWQVPPER